MGSFLLENARTDRKLNYQRANVAESCDESKRSLPHEKGCGGLYRVVKIMVKDFRGSVLERSKKYAR